MYSTNHETYMQQDVCLRPKQINYRNVTCKKKEMYLHWTEFYTVANFTR